MFPNIAMDMPGGSTVLANVPTNSDNSGNSSGSGGGGHQYYHHRGAAAAAVVVDGQQQQQQPPPPPSRYESQKRRDWNTFGQYLRNHRPPLALCRCSGAHVLEFLRYLDQFGKTKVHAHGCPFFGHPHPPAPCPCPLRQAWGSLDALIGRLRAAFEENGGAPEANPFAARAVRLYLRDVRDTQAKARGIAYDKKKRKRPPPPPPPQPPPPAPMPTAILHGGGGPIMAASNAGDANLQVTDLNSSDGFVMMHQPQYHLYHLYHHHGDHESTSTGSGSTGSGSGGVVMAAPDSHSGSLIPLSLGDKDLASKEELKLMCMLQSDEVF